MQFWLLKDNVNTTKNWSNLPLKSAFKGNFWPIWNTKKEKQKTENRKLKSQTNCMMVSRQSNILNDVQHV